MRSEYETQHARFFSLCLQHLFYLRFYLRCFYISLNVLLTGKHDVSSLSAMKCHDLLLSLLLISIASLKIQSIDGFSTPPSAFRHNDYILSRPVIGIEKSINESNSGYKTDSSTQLGVAVDPSTIVASLALVGSSAVGMHLDRRLPSSGILGTLMTAALFSNTLPMVPLHHPLYDLCWTWILPGSLALLLLGYRANDNSTSFTTKEATDDEMDASHQQQTIIKAIGRVAGPFLLASVGSILGCWASYQFAVAGRWFSTTAQARAATSCLAASYVGGSVNLFATAKIIQAPASLLSSMATADLIAMALYFSVLSSTMEWNWLRSLFFRDAEDDKESKASSDIGSSTITTNTEEPLTPSLCAGGKMKPLSILPLLLGLTGLIVATANRVESYLGRWIPGTACGVIAVVAPLLRSVVHRSIWIQDRSKEWTVAASTLADWFFFLFFAAIGVGVDLKATLQMGPACLLVSLLALAVHLVVTVAGSHFCLPTKRWGVALEDLWIASNAAIGGPATAAAFCNRMKGGNPLALWGRTVAATVWGVVGYGIGTLVGVGLYRFLAPAL